MNAQELIAKGYRRVSSRHRIVTRIDREDWKERLAADLGRSVADLYIMGSNGGVPVVGRAVAGQWCDYYRRVMSRDKIEGVPEDVFKLIPSSCHDPCGYVPINEAGGTPMARWSVTYYYLATGMEGHPDTADYGVVLAATAADARNKVAQDRFPHDEKAKQFFFGCLTARKLAEIEGI